MKIIFIAILLLSTPYVQAEDWITEEVLKQLSEVRQELKELQKEVNGLKEALNNRPVGTRNDQPIANKNLNLSDTPSIGKSSAKIAIVEFSDYQCPYCKRHFSQTLPEIEKKYIDTGKVQYYMKQFPLGFHAKAKGASIAALCIEKLKPGHYWEAHEAIFSGQTNLDNDAYRALATSLKIKQKKFDACLDDPLLTKKVDDDMSDGQSVGVSGTPAFLIGEIVDGRLVRGQLLTGARPYSSFSSIVERLLQ